MAYNLTLALRKAGRNRRVRGGGVWVYSVVHMIIFTVYFNTQIMCFAEREGKMYKWVTQGPFVFHIVLF